MIKTFTQDDLIRYLYQEISEEERVDIKNALVCDNDLMDDFKNLLDVKENLDQNLEQPSNTVISSILSYSKSFNLHPAR